MHPPSIPPTAFEWFCLPVAMDDGVEGEAVLPGIGEILDADAGVLGRRPLRPSKKGLLGRHGLVLAHHAVGNLHGKNS